MVVYGGGVLVGKPWHVNVKGAPHTGRHVFPYGAKSISPSPRKKKQTHTHTHARTHAHTHTHPHPSILTVNSYNVLRNNHIVFSVYDRKIKYATETAD